jgi:hypothetical protein
MLYWRRTGLGWREQMNVKQWMRDWQERFGSIGVELIVADVAQSSVVVDVAERTVVLAPSLKLSVAEKVLHKIHAWWERQSDTVEEHSCSLVSC